MRKWIKYILVIIVFVILMFLGNIVRKYYIINKFLEKEEILKSASNYYIKETYEDGTIREVYYKKGNYIYNRISNGVTQTYYNVNGKSLVIINDGTDNLEIHEYEPKTTGLNFPNTTYYLLHNFVDKLKMTLRISIRIEDCDGLKAYCLDDSRLKTWIDKNTYITLQTNNRGSIQKYEIQLNVVTDEDLKEPDIREYTVQENN